MQTRGYFIEVRDDINYLLRGYKQIDTNRRNFGLG